MTTAISHLVHEPDWLMLRCQSPEVCAESIQSILKTLENNERWVYAVRGEALRLFDDRQLYALFLDPATGDRCSCVYRWLQVFLPDSARYCQEALVSRQKLHDTIPLEVAQNVTRTNLRLLEGTSESVRRLPEIQEAAQTMSETAFRGKLNTEFHQHFDARRTLKFTLDAGDAEQVERALDIIGEKTGFKDRPAQLLSWALDYIDENEDEDDGNQSECTGVYQPSAH